MYKIFSIFIILISLFSCQPENTYSQRAEAQEQLSQLKKGDEVVIDISEAMKHKEGINWRNGTVVYLDLEGGFYGIVDENKEKLLPLNLAPQFKKQGTIIKFKGTLEKDLISIQQWGTAFTITDIELIKNGKDSNNPEY